MKKNQVNITLQRKNVKINFITNIRKDMIAEYERQGFKVLSIQY